MGLEKQQANQVISSGIHPSYARFVLPWTSPLGSLGLVKREGQARGRGLWLSL